MAEVSLNDIMTSNVYLEIPGENGIHTFYFRRLRQYIITGREVRKRFIDSQENVMNMGGDERTHVEHYKIESEDGTDYCWFPAIYGAIEGKVRTPEEQDYRIYRERVVVDQPRDWKKAYKELTGREIKRFVSYNGAALEKEAELNRLKNNGKVYGKSEPRDD